MLSATGAGFGNEVVVPDLVAVLDENEAFEEVPAVPAADGARDTAPLVIAKGWLPAGK